MATFVLGAALSAGLAISEQRQADAIHQARLAATADTVRDALTERLNACAMLARSVQTLFLASDRVEPIEFAHLYASLRPRESFPSLQAMAFAERQPRADGVHYITTLIQPVTGNEALFGLDVGGQPANLRALLASRDNDEPQMSAPFPLVQQPAGEPVLGVALRLPVFGKGLPPADVRERRERIVGSLAISFSVAELIGRAIPADSREAMHVRVSDVTGGEPRLLLDSHPAPHGNGEHGATRTLHFGGRRWQLDVDPLAEPLAAGPYGWQSVLWPGLLASALLSLLVWSVLTSRRRALELGWRMSRRYRESEERFRVLNELLPALVLLADADDGRITYANQASRLRLGEVVDGRVLSELFADADFGTRLPRGDFAGLAVEARLVGVAGDRFWASVAVARVDVNGEAMLLMVASDVGEQRQLTEMLGYQASHDSLTDLFNRREFERRVERVLVTAVAGGPPAALLYLDLDQFKLVNDTSGHAAGDQLLVQLAAMMRRELGGTGALLARLGGDEFGMLLPDAGSKARADEVAERLRQCIDGYVFAWEKRTYSITASIGGVMLDQPGTIFRDVLARADAACYMAKESGRNRVHFYSASDDETHRRQSEMEWATRLRWAVDEGRLLLMYQELRPLSAEADGTRIELLLRFRDEAGRLVPPGAFMPAAERYGLMPMIDRWVIETALSNFDRLHPAGEGLALATINLSGASIEDEALAERILALLERHRIAPERVCFEITETVAVRNLPLVAGFLARLRAVGCRLALDDFGAGMSSFGYLKNLPVDIIKIDGSFIRDLRTDPMSRAIVRAISDIGHERGLVVVAEWVDDLTLLDALASIGIDYAQGFALHRPEPVPFHRPLAGPDADA